MKCAVAALLCALALRPSAAVVTHLGSFTAIDASFLSLYPVGSATTLVISQFTGDPLAADSVGFVYDIGSYVTSGTINDVKVAEVTTAIVWPNDLEAAPSPSGIGSFHGILAPGGFLVPPKVCALLYVLLQACFWAWLSCDSLFGR